MDSSMVERVPPADVDAEAHVLSCCLVDADAREVVFPRLQPEDFYTTPHQMIYRQMQLMAKRQLGIDVITLRAALGDAVDAVGGFGYLVDLGAMLPTTSMVDHYAAVVRDRAQRRRLIRHHHSGLDAAYNTDVQDPHGAAMAGLLALEARQAGGAVRVGDVASAVLNDVHRARTARDAMSRPRPAAATGLHDVDQRVWIDHGDMVILSGRPSSGKTALAMQAAVHVARHFGPVYVASLETRARILAMRMLARMTGVSTHRQRTGYISEQDANLLDEAEVQLADLPLWVDDDSSLDARGIMARARAFRARHGELALVLVDHLHIVARPPRMFPTQAITEISRELKVGLRGLGVPGLILAQFSREVEKEDRDPRMSDIRDSGAVEQDADAIMLLHRPERQGEDGEPLEWSDAKLIVAKNKEGPVGSHRLRFQGSRQQFSLA